MAEYDMTVCVGPERKCIPANSAILRFTSPVFRAMLGPNFAEGAQLRSSHGGFELNLPDDDAAATETVIAILHHTWNPPNYLPKEWLFPLAQVAHKYNCVAIVKAAIVGRWSLCKEPRIARGTTSGFMLLSRDQIELEFSVLAAAFVFATAFRFRISLNDIICGSFESLRHLQSHVGMDYLPEDIVDLLTEARAAIRMRLAEAYGRLVSQQEDEIEFYDFNRTQDNHRWVQLTSGTCSIGSMVISLLDVCNKVWPSLRPFVTQGLLLQSDGRVGFKDRNNEALRLKIDDADGSDGSDSDEDS